MSYTSPVLANTETPMTLASLCRLDGKYRAIEISPGFVVVDITRPPQSGDTVAFSLCSGIQFARVQGSSLITPDGDVLEGDALDDVQVVGVVIFLIKEINNDELPTI
ncbi:TPA: hypothetical protein LUY34_002807 [Enterobacter hormaechei subsp. xiangfangensis]|nr:hypothetical protein [Enterobacter hormaechei subsp. xiangfangensis]